MDSDEDHHLFGQDGWLEGDQLKDARTWITRFHR